MGRLTLATYSSAKIVDRAGAMPKHAKLRLSDGRRTSPIRVMSVLRPRVARTLAPVLNSDRWRNSISQDMEPLRVSDGIHSVASRCSELASQVDSGTPPVTGSPSQPSAAAMTAGHTVVGRRGGDDCPATSHRDQGRRRRGLPTTSRMAARQSGWPRKWCR